MAIFTPIDNDLARQILNDYDLGGLTRLEGIAAGIENSNYFLDTTEGAWVLTVFEILKEDQMPFYLELMAHLAAAGLNVPEPQRRRDGKLFGMLEGKPAAIVTRLPGKSIESPTARHCQLAGAMQARMHVAVQDFKRSQPNLRGLSWWRQQYPAIRPFLSTQTRSQYEAALNAQIQLQSGGAWQALPQGACHCDLFRDNVLFDEQDGQPTMGGVIDFYFAGADKLIFDMAVALNDWCINRHSKDLVPELCHAWLSSYESVRPLSPEEKKLLPQALQAAALRFWTSRLYDYHLPRAALNLTPHDPEHFEHIVRQRTHNIDNIIISINY